MLDAAKSLESRDGRPPDHVIRNGVSLRAGDRVRLRPHCGGDIFDLALAGKIGKIAAVEQDYENRIHLAITVEDDPGRDLGEAHQIGHRFFFRPEEVEPLSAAESDEWASRIGEQGVRLTRLGDDPSAARTTPRILIGGIGNIFLGDDGFGVEVVMQLAKRPLGPEVRVVDFGIRGYDLTYSLMEDWDAVILVDAAPRGQPPGTLYLIEPECANGNGPGEAVAIDAHNLSPARVLQLVQSMGGHINRLLVVGCEPQPVAGENDMRIGLSEAVRAAVGEAVPMIETLVTKILRESEQRTQKSP